MTMLSTAVVAIALAATSPSSVDGIAITTHRWGGSDSGPGVHESVFGDIMRHDIKDGRVTRSAAIYKGKARGAAMSPDGKMIAFLLLNGHVHVMNIDGTGFKELGNTRNHNASALDWPEGEWVYYSEEGRWPTGNWFGGETNSPSAKTIRRVNVLTGADEVVGMTSQPIWQLSLASRSGKDAGRFAVTNVLADFTDPGRNLNQKTLACGTAVSPAGSYVTEVLGTHAEIRVYDWSLEKVMATFRVNAFANGSSDGRVSIYRPRWSVNAEHWVIATQGMDFGCTQKTNAALYNWRDGIQIQLTRNPTYGDESDEGEDFWVAGVASDLAGGTVTGEAPFTVDFREQVKGSASWTFGDTLMRSSEGKHTYAKPGTYTITVKTSPKTELRQTVTVEPSSKPELVLCQLVDDRHVYLQFNEPVRISENRPIKLERGRTKVSGVSHREGTASVIVEFDSPLGEDGQLDLSGIEDGAQKPNGLASPKAAVEVSTWPTNRAALGFVWRTNDQPNHTYDPVNRQVLRNSVFVWDGISTFDKYGAMACVGGSSNTPISFHGTPVFKNRFPFMSSQDLIRHLCQERKGLTVEAQLSTDKLDQRRGDGGPVPIIAMADNMQHGSLWLAQQGRDIVFRVGCGKDMGFVPVCKLPDSKRHHLVVTCADADLRAYLDGREVLKSADFSGPVRIETQMLTFFDTQKRTGHSWRGRLEGIAIYGRAMSASETMANFQAYQGKAVKRATAPQIDLYATLSKASRVKSVADIAPYDSAFVVNEYVVAKVYRGEYTAKTIRVAEWGVVRKKIQPANRRFLGARHRLVVEKLSDNPQYEAIFVVDKLPEDFDAEIYVVVESK